MKNGRFVIDHSLKQHLDPEFGVRKETKLIIVHTIAEFLEDYEGNVSRAEDFLIDTRLLPHYMITPSGVVERMLHHDRIGAHAKGFNHCSVGIEVMIPGFMTYAKFVDATREDRINSEQFNQLIKLLQELYKIYPEAYIVGHHEIDPERKVDPGEYILVEELREHFIQPEDFLIIADEVEQLRV